MTAASLQASKITPFRSIRYAYSSPLSVSSRSRRHTYLVEGESTMSQFDADMRKLNWEASKRAKRSGLIKEGVAERALELHIAGRYEEAIAAISRIPERDRTASEWRVLGHAELGCREFQKAIAAHLASMSANAGDPSAVSDDKVNLAAVFIAMNNYDAAWEAAEDARRLAPRSIMPWTPRIAILNRTGRHEELRRTLSELLAERPAILDDPVFRDHTENDVDFIGVKELIADITSENGRTQ